MTSRSHPLCPKQDTILDHASLIGGAEAEIGHLGSQRQRKRRGHQSSRPVDLTDESAFPKRLPARDPGRKGRNWSTLQHQAVRKQTTGSIKAKQERKRTRLNSSHYCASRMTSSA